MTDKNLKADDIDGMVTDCEAKIGSVVHQFRSVYPRLLNAFVDDLRIRISTVLSDATSKPNEIVSMKNEIIILDDYDNQTKVKSESIQLAINHPPIISLDADDHVDRINTKDPCVQQQHPTNSETLANDIGENQTIVLDEAEFSHTESKVTNGFVENIMDQPLPNLVKVINKNQPSGSNVTINSHKNNSEIVEDVVINGTSLTSVELTKQFAVDSSSDDNASLNQPKIISIDDNNGTNANDCTETASIPKEQIKSRKRKAGFYYPRLVRRPTTFK